MGIKDSAKYWRKKAGENIYKKGLGFNSTISAKHSYDFTMRFQQENAAILKEAEEERIKINKRKAEHYMKVNRFRKREDYKKRFPN